VKKQDLLGLFDLTGKVALVTGATGAIGFAAASTLAAAGARVMLTGLEADIGEKCVAQLRADGGEASFRAADAVSHEEVARVVSETVDTYGGVDILVTAAGINLPAPITEQSDVEWQSVIDANLCGTYYYCKEIVKAMIGQGRGGKIILIGSVRGELGYTGYTAYSPSKAAVHALAKSLACEVGPHGINVNAIAPGVTRSALTQWMYDDPEGPVYQSVAKRMPMGRLGEPKDCEGAILFLASPASDWVNGHILRVDGGYSAQ
jgi:NAD(P)-dependent dehydrogenase (short-subunit alcohol dehydrogenase family)